MKFKQGAIGGVMGALVMTLAMGIGRVFHVPVNLEALLGSLLTGKLSFGTWCLGLALHLGIGAGLGMVYAFVLEAAFRRSSWALGVAVSVPHLVLAGVGLGLIAAIHPLLPDALVDPGMFMMDLGPPAFAGFVILHLVFGAIVGGMCARREPERTPRDTGWAHRSPPSGDAAHPSATR